MIKDVVEYINERTLWSIKDMLKENRPIVGISEDMPDPRPYNNTGRLREQHAQKNDISEKAKEFI